MALTRFMSFLPLAILGCASVPVPEPPVRVPTRVGAPFSKTWDAVVDLFAEKNIAIRNMDKASGFIAAEPSAVTDDAKAWANCGGFSIYGGPSSAAYNVLVRGDSISSTVRMTVRWVHASRAGIDKTRTCATTGALEDQIEGQIRARAESK